jgi:hypothetical protein
VPAAAIPERLRHPMLREIYGYWDAKRGGRMMPRRSDIDPSEIPKLLPRILIVQALGDGRFRYRLAGTAIVEAFGVEITGTLVGDIAHGEYRAQLLTIYETAFAARRPLLAYSRYYGVQRIPRSAVRLLMPLSPDDRVMDQVLSLHVFDQDGLQPALPGAFDGSHEQVRNHAIELL